MKELFIPYNLALLAKEKGFDESCLAGFLIGDKGQFDIFGLDTNHESLLKNSSDEDNWLTAPLYQQIIDWFRTKDIHIIIRPGFGAITWYDWRIVSLEHEDICAEQNESYEQINDCYTKAIEEAFKLI